MEGWHYEGSSPSLPKKKTTSLPKQLSLKNFKVHIGSTFSDLHVQEVIPQGNILMVTSLFSIKITLIKCLNPRIENGSYGDDLMICYRSKFILIIELQLMAHTKWGADQKNFLKLYRS